MRCIATHGHAAPRVDKVRVMLARLVPRLRGSPLLAAKARSMLSKLVPHARKALSNALSCSTMLLVWLLLYGLIVDAT